MKIHLENNLSEKRQSSTLSIHPKPWAPSPLTLLEIRALFHFLISLFSSSPHLQLEQGELLGIPCRMSWEWGQAAAPSLQHPRNPSQVNSADTHAARHRMKRDLLERTQQIRHLLEL